MKNNQKGGLKYKCPGCRDKVSTKPKHRNQSITSSGQKSRKVNQSCEQTSGNLLFEVRLFKDK
jgi:hypothetical protein